MCLVMPRSSPPPAIMAKALDASANPVLAKLSWPVWADTCPVRPGRMAPGSSLVPTVAGPKEIGFQRKLFARAADVGRVLAANFRDHAKSHE